MDTQTTAPDTTPVALGPDMTIAQAAAWRDTLVDALCTASGNLALDLSAVTDIDSAGLQLLLATRRSLHERGAALTLAGLSPTVADALAVFGLDPQLDAVGPLTGAQA
jgi:anti-anti-sigma factor